MLDRPTSGDALPLDRLQTYLRAFFSTHPNLRVESATPVPGVHSREIHFVQVSDEDGWQKSLVVRRDRQFNLTPGTVADEAAAMEVMSAEGLRTPQLIAVDRSAIPLDRPFVVMPRLSGEALNLATSSKPAQILLEIATFAAHLHAIPEAKIEHLHGSERGASLIMRMIGDAHQVWLESGYPLGEEGRRGLRWLEENASVGAQSHCLIHGDFQCKQFLVEQDNLTALLDFELTRIGHPAEDLASIRYDVETHLPWDEFLNAYIDSGGSRAVIPALPFNAVWLQFRNAAFVARGAALFDQGKLADPGFSSLRTHVFPKKISLLREALERANR